MRFTVNLKTPDALDRAVKDALQSDQPTLAGYELDSAAFALKEACAKWFQCGETVTLEIDTDAETCKVLPVKG